MVVRPIPDWEACSGIRLGLARECREGFANRRRDRDCKATRPVAAGKEALRRASLLSVVRVHLILLYRNQGSGAAADSG